MGLCLPPISNSLWAFGINAPIAGVLGEKGLVQWMTGVVG